MANRVTGCELRVTSYCRLRSASPCQAVYAQLRRAKGCCRLRSASPCQAVYTQLRRAKGYCRLRSASTTIKYLGVAATHVQYANLTQA